MKKAPGSSRQFGNIVRRAIREHVLGASVTNLTVQSVKFPTGIRGFIAKGVATGKGRTARFTAISTGTGFRVDFYGEGAA
jgi:hypothetical protein